MDVAKSVYGFLYFFRKLYKQPSSFTFNNQQFTYFEHPYNGTWMNERAIEIPVILECIKPYPPDTILELGNVLSHYFRVKHLIVDKYEHKPGVIAKDILDVELSKKLDCIFSISTLEHIGWDEVPRLPGKHIQAIDKMKQLLSTDGKIFATIPLGYNPYFDHDLFNEKLGCSKISFFKRLSREIWHEASQDQVRDSKYGKKYRTTEGLALCVWRK